MSEVFDYHEPAYAFSRKLDLKRNVIAQIGQLFPEYSFFGSRKEGIDYSLGADKVDVLLEKEGILLAVALIPGLASFEAFGSFSRILGLLLERFPERRVRGCIIAGEIDRNLRNAVRTSEYISLNTYTLGLRLQPGYLSPEHHKSPSKISIFRSLFWF